jgi:transposase
MLAPSLSSRSMSANEPHQSDMPLKSATSSIFSPDDTAMTTEVLLSRLESLLVAKSQEIQLAGRLGESLLSQQAELENRIRDLEQDAVAASADPTDRRARSHGGHVAEPSERSQVGDDVRRKLESLESEMRQWEVENDEMYRTAGIARSATVRAA